MSARAVGQERRLAGRAVEAVELVVLGAADVAHVDHGVLVAGDEGSPADGLVGEGELLPRSEGIAELVKLGDVGEARGDQDAVASVAE